MTDKDHIDEMLAKLRERIPGLEWSSIGDRVYGELRLSNRNSVTMLRFRLYTYRGVVRAFASEHWGDEPRDIDHFIDREIEWLQERLAEYAHALKGAK